MGRIILIVGVVYGVFSSLLSFLYYLQIGGVFTSMFIGMILAAVAAAVGILAFRSKYAGFSTFQENLKLVFGILLLGIVISGIVSQVSMRMISEETKEEMINDIFESTIASYESMGVPVTPEVEEMLTAQAEGMFSFKNYMLGVPLILFLYGGIGLVVAFFMRKDPPAGSTNSVESSIA